MKLPVQLLVSGGVTMAAPGAASSVNTLAGGHEARSLSATAGGCPVWLRANVLADRPRSATGEQPQHDSHARTHTERQVRVLATAAIRTLFQLIVREAPRRRRVAPVKPLPLSPVDKKGALRFSDHSAPQRFD